jgi:hypothetical protein
MMWQSRKALDLLRDPRVVVHSVSSDRMNAGGDVKLYGRIVDEWDPGVPEAFRDAIQARIDWTPDEPNYHCLSLDVQEAGYIRFDDDPLTLAWEAEPGVRTFKNPG